mmetsp:Transcript_31416/g.81217  ORF Transcript_31416/g.81217 Transcript_31416/m.81217 type:complete len:324 (-) Transcript_31416:67-1038(-)
MAPRALAAVLELLQRRHVHLLRLPAEAADSRRCHRRLLRLRPGQLLARRLRLTSRPRRSRRRGCRCIRLLCAAPLPGAAALPLRPRLACLRAGCRGSGLLVGCAGEAALWRARPLGWLTAPLLVILARLGRHALQALAAEGAAVPLSLVRHVAGGQVLQVRGLIPEAVATGAEVMAHLQVVGPQVGAQHVADGAEVLRVDVHRQRVLAVVGGPALEAAELTLHRFRLARSRRIGHLSVLAARPGRRAGLIGAGHDLEVVVITAGRTIAAAGGARPATSATVTAHHTSSISYSDFSAVSRDWGGQELCVVGPRRLSAQLCHSGV